VNNIPGPLDQKNRENIDRWRWRVHLQGGTMHYCGHDLQDFRDMFDMEIWRKNEQKLREARRAQMQIRKVVNLAKLRIQRARKKA
jgi:hypothetical protein